MYVSAISIRLLRGRSTPAMRAIRVLSLSALALLVTRVFAEHPDDAVPPDDLALTTDGFHGCAYLHREIPQGSVKIYGPSGVTATECSKWAESRPSRVA